MSTVRPIECWDAWSAAQAAENPTGVASPHWYGLVAVAMPHDDIEVGVWLGVPPSDEVTRLAAGGGVAPHLTAVYAHWSDWDGCSAEFAEDVLAAVYAQRHALWDVVMPEVRCACHGCDAVATHHDESVAVCGDCYEYHLDDDGQVVCPTHAVEGQNR